VHIHLLYSINYFLLTCLLTYLLTYLGSHNAVNSSEKGAVVNSSDRLLLSSCLLSNMY